MPAGTPGETGEVWSTTKTGPGKSAEGASSRVLSAVDAAGRSPDDDDLFPRHLNILWRAVLRGEARQLLLAVVRIHERGRGEMKRTLAYIFATPLLLFVLGFQGTCHSQCEVLVPELRADCKDDLGANNDLCREEFQELPQE
jgi:hypothetical protein